MAKPNIFDRAVIAVAPVHAAKRAAARAASMPACPAPMTAISNCPASNSLIQAPYARRRVNTATSGRLNRRTMPPRPRETNTSAPRQV